MPEFRRDRLTWVAYLVLAWFAYLQAAPGLVIGHLRAELGPVVLALAAAALTVMRPRRTARRVAGIR